MRIPLTQTSAACVVDALIRLWNFVEDPWECHIGSMSAKPNNVILLTDTGGRKAGRIQRSGEDVLKHSFQVRVRSTTYETGWQMAKRIENGLLRGVRNKKVTVKVFEGLATEYNLIVDAMAFMLTSPTTFLGLNENNRTREFSLNGLLTAMEIH